MKQRVITAIIALAVFIPILIVGGWAIEVTAAVLAVVGVYELFKMKGLTIASFSGVVSALAALFLVLPLETYFSFLPESLTSSNLFYFFVMILLTETVFSKNSYTLDQAAFPVIVSLYVGMGFKCFLLARGTTADLTMLLFGLLVVWSTDIGAYMIGRKIGKNKLAPAISPNKTLEGAFGGIVSAVVVAAIYLNFFATAGVFHQGLPVMLLFTVFLSMVGQMGDLVESAYKRHYGVKDSGNILPGHGGILDRFDSMIFVFPVMHLLGLF